MSAPHSIGRHRYGVANVLSTISGSSCGARWLRRSRGPARSRRGLPIVSPKNALCSADRLRHTAGSSGSTHVSFSVIFQRVLELVHRSAVERRGGRQRGRPGSSSVISAALRGEPAGERHRAPAASRFADPLLEYRHGRVHDARVLFPYSCRLNTPLPIPGPRTHSWWSGRSAPHVRPFRVGPLPGVQLPGLESERAILPRPTGETVLFFCHCRHPQETTDNRRLPRLLEQEAVVAVRRLDHTATLPACPRREARRASPERGRRVRPVGTERSAASRRAPSSARAGDPPPYSARGRIRRRAEV